jgi:hypothetical protein
MVSFETCPKEIEKKKKVSNNNNLVLVDFRNINNGLVGFYYKVEV